MNIIKYIKNLKAKKRPQPGDIIITKTPEQVKLENLAARKAGTCPYCNKYNPFNGGIHDYEYEYYTCHNEDCGAKWKIKK